MDLCNACNKSVDGKEVTTAVTDKLNVTSDVFNINIGLKENLIFDLQLNKYIISESTHYLIVI